MQALTVAEGMLAMVGEGWLIGQSNMPDVQKSFPSDR